MAKQRFGMSATLAPEDEARRKRQERDRMASLGSGGVTSSSPVSTPRLPRGGVTLSPQVQQQVQAQTPSVAEMPARSSFLAGLPRQTQASASTVTPTGNPLDIDQMTQNVMRRSGLTPGNTREAAVNAEREKIRQEVASAPITPLPPRSPERDAQLIEAMPFEDRKQVRDAQSRIRFADQDAKQAQIRREAVRGINDSSAVRRNPAELGLTAEQFRGMGGQPDFSGMVRPGLRRFGAGFGATTGSGTNYGTSSGPINTRLGDGTRLPQAEPMRDPMPAEDAQRIMEQANAAAIARGQGPGQAIPSQLPRQPAHPGQSMRPGQRRDESSDQFNQRLTDIADFRTQNNPLARHQNQLRLQRQPFPGEDPQTYQTRQAIMQGEISNGSFGRFQQQQRAQERQFKMAERQQGFERFQAFSADKQKIGSQIDQLEAERAAIRASSAQGVPLDAKSATRLAQIEASLPGLLDQESQVGEMLSIARQSILPQQAPLPDAVAPAISQPEPAPPPESQAIPNPPRTGESDATHGARQTREAVVGAVSEIPGLLRRGSTFFNDKIEGWTGIPRPGSTSMHFSIAMRENLRAKGMEETPDNFQRVQQEFEEWQQQNGTGDVVNDLRAWNQASMQFAGLRMPELVNGVAPVN